MTLIGAHNLGHVHPQFSGYNGHPGFPANTDITVNAWDNTPTVFDNEYFNTLVNVVCYFVILELVYIYILSYLYSLFISFIVLRVGETFLTV